MAVPTSQIESITQHSFYQLNNASDNFRNANRDQGFDHFKLVYALHQNKIYEQIWIDRGMPVGNLEYGRQTFHDTDGLSSNMQEKAEAIDRYLESVDRLIAYAFRNDPRSLVNGYEDQNYIRDPEKYEITGRVRDDYYPLVESDKVWCPTTQKQLLEITLITGSCAAVGTAAFAVYKIFKAVQGA